MDFILRTYVDADLSGDRLTRQSWSGMLIFMNSAASTGYPRSKLQSRQVLFFSESVAMKICCDDLRGLRYKLRMVGIPVIKPVFIHGDNQSVLWNTTIPDSTLNNKSNSIAYCFVREVVARDEWRISYIKTDTTPSDITTKALPVGINRKRKLQAIMYDIYPEEDNE